MRAGGCSRKQEGVDYDGVMHVEVEDSAQEQNRATWTKMEEQPWSVCMRSWDRSTCTSRQTTS